MIVDLHGIQLDLALRHDNPVYWTLGAVIGGSITLKILRYFIGYMNLKNKRNKKRKTRDASLIAFENQVKKSNLSSAKRQEILGLDIENLLAKLKSGELQSSDVLEAYQGKALEAQKKTNCLVEPISEAEELVGNLGSKDGLLYGLPVSIKDNYGLQGYDSTIGCSNWIDKPFPEDAVMVKVLKAEGAIPFVKTNVPQTMISYETTNPIYGETRNPQDLSRGVGGSSGGEGALVASGGSILGFGSDIGGSIRIPASMCGVCGFKTTAGRLSTKGTHPLYKGQMNLLSAYGPLARDVAGLVLGVRALCSPKAWAIDPCLPPVPFNMDAYKNRDKLRIGFLVTDPYFDAVPAMQRGVLEAKEKLAQLGHELVPWYMPGLAERSTKFWALSLFADGGNLLRELLKNDATDVSVLPLKAVLGLPAFAKKALSFLLAPFLKKLSLTLKWSCGFKNIGEWWDLTMDTNKLRDEVIQDWKEKGLDAMICPGFSCLPLPFGESAYASGATLYTMIFNMINFPAGSLPVTRVTDEDMRKLADYPTPDIWQKTVKKGMKGTEKLIVNVQVVTLPWKEELCLRVMKDLEEAVAFKRDW